MEHKGKMRYWTQVLSSIGVCFANLMFGTAIGYPTAALPQLEVEEDPQLVLDEQTRSWFAPTFNICLVIFMIPGGILCNKIGRRGIMLFAIPFIIVGWLLIGFALNRVMLFIGRIVVSAFTSMFMTAPGVYVSETTHPNIRASMVVMSPFFLSFGYMLVWSIGYISTWKVVAFCCIPPCCVLFISLLFLPETPYWLIEKNQFEKASESLKFFRGPHYDIAQEIDEIHQKHLSKPKSKSVKWIFKRIFSGAFLKPYLCIGILEALFAVCGFEIVVLYMVQVLKETGSSIDPNLGPVIVGSVRIVTAGIMPLLIQKISPKPLFFITQLIHASAIGALCVFSYFKIDQESELDQFAWIPLASIIVVIIMRAIGSLPVMHTLVNELYPTDIRTHAIAITDTIGIGVSAINLKMFPELKNALGYFGMFGFYTSMGVVMAFWGLLTIKDNRGKSLVKVEESYENKVSSRRGSII